MLLTSRADLEALAHRIATELARINDKAPLTLVPELTAKSSFDGWFVDIAKLPNGTTFTVFLDRSAGKQIREPWYGFSTAQRASVDILAKAASAVLGHEPTRDAEVRPLRRGEYGRLFVEEIGPREFYVGVYVPVRRVILRRIARFARDVANVLKPQLRRTAHLEGAAPGTYLTPRTRQALLGRRGQTAFRRRLVRVDGASCSLSGPTPPFLLVGPHCHSARTR